MSGRRLAALLALACLLTAPACRAVETSSTSSAAAVTADGYTAEQIYDYFRETVFTSEYGGYRGMLCRFEREIVCFVAGEFAEGEMEVLRDLASRLNTIPGFPGIRMTDREAEATLTVHFVMQGELQDIFGEHAASSSGMSRIYWEKLSGKIVRAEAGIATNIAPQNAKASVICEELLQSLGVSADSYTHPESVFYEGYSDVTRPAEIDWAVLALLYSECMYAGMPEEDALAAARELLGIPEAEA